MIHIDRRNIAGPNSLILPGSTGQIEREAAIHHFSKKKPIGKFIFKAYKKPDVKEALIKLFNSKCAYCESRFLHVYPGDIEHFRPKAAVMYPKEEKIKINSRGYYWLASDWNNLLLSCKNCNSANTNLLPDGTKKVTGKSTFFPLSNPKKHLTTHNQRISTEEKYRLLIDPCTDNPETLLKYDEKTGVVKARKKDSFSKLKAEKSINIYGLDRMTLVHQRKIVIVNCFEQIKRIEQALENLRQSKTRKHILKFSNIYIDELNILKSYNEPSREFSAVAKQIYKKYAVPLLPK